RSPHVRERAGVASEWPYLGKGSANRPIKEETAMPEFRVYVIELSANACKRTDCAAQRTGKPHVYVGETKKTPEERLADHLAGGFTSRPVVPTHAPHLPP